MTNNAPPMPKKFLTNHGENTLKRRLEKILPKTQRFDCLVGYFFISGFFRIYPVLEPVQKIRILIGLKNEEVIHGLLHIAHHDTDKSRPSIAQAKTTFSGMLKKELLGADDKVDIELGVRKFVEWIRSGKLEVKLHREQNIHAKVYIMTPENPIENVHHGYVITGSSNLSYGGLEGNLEFNVVLGEPEEYDYALYCFNMLWQNSIDVEDVHETILDVVEKESPFAAFTPYVLYLKFLAEYFRDYLGDRSLLQAKNIPQNFKKLSYQEDAVFAAHQILKAFGGVFLADVVGLGKTYISALLALQLNGRCLIIAPPHLLDENSPGAWPRVFRDFCIPGYQCASIGKLEEVIEQGVDAYQYVFIDESHRFKGDVTRRYEHLARICQGKGVILVSATPYNNTLDDIYSQLRLFQPARDSAIPGVRNVEAFFQGLRGRTKGLHRFNDAERYIAAVEQNARTLRNCVLKYVMVRRTRREVEQFYAADLRQQGIIFPVVNDPVPLFYQLHHTESAVFMRTLAYITGADFHYARYQQMDARYYTGEIDDRIAQGQRNLATFMKILLVKRLESSFYAFRETLGRFIQSHRLVLEAFDHGVVYTSKKYSNKVLEYLEEGNDEAMDVLIAEEKVEALKAADFTPLFRAHVASDLAILHKIQALWESVQRDPKWEALKQQLTTVLAKERLVIFTEYVDTAHYLADRVKKEVEPKIILFSSWATPALRRDVIANFDANDPSPADDYRILIATDALSEGVNLHRSGTVINYDIPWNPSRMMQRVGRVNRIGTQFKAISTYNFFPTDEGNDEIALTESAKSKIHAFITLLGNDAPLLTGDEPVTSHHLFERINSKASVEDSQEERSELQYLRQVLDVKAQQPVLFQRILALPRKARSTRCRASMSTPIAHADQPAVLTYFRQGQLDKFYRSRAESECAEEIDFLTAVDILETTDSEALSTIPFALFYALLDKNKAGFQSATTPNAEAPLSSVMSRSSHEATLLKRLCARTFRNPQALNAIDRAFADTVYRAIADGRVAKKTIRRVKQGFDGTDDPLAMMAILRQEVHLQYVLDPTHQSVQNSKDATQREVILSSYLL